MVGEQVKRLCGYRPKRDISASVDFLACFGEESRNS